MSSLLLTTKLHVPQVRMERVLRPRLVSHLQQGLDKKLILISAPAGYGKTTLLCEWLAACNLPTVWVSLDRADSDPERFWMYTITALQSVFSSTGEIPPEIQLHHNSPMDEILLTDLINELDKLHQPLILVLDDLHNIENQTIYDGLSYLLEHAPAQFHLVITTRVDPPLPLARLRARSQMIELRSADLRFTTREVAEFLRTVMRLDLSEADLSMLEHSTEGWIAGLQMAGLSLQGRENASAFIRSFSGVDRHILDFLFEEVFQRQPEEIQRFLLQSSILGRISAPLCDAVVLRADSQFILDTLERSNLFLISLDEQRKWYRYHHLFSDLLRLMLEKAHPGLSVQLHRRACLWYEAQGMISEALDHALSSGDMQLVAQIVSGNVLVLLETNEIQPTLAKIDSLPIDKVTEIPWLGIARAWVMGPGQFQKSQQILDAIEKNITNEPVSADLQRLKGHIAAARAFVLGAQEDEAIVLRYAKDANELLPPEDMAVRAMNLMSWANRLVANENNSSAMPILKQAMTLALQATKPHIAMIAASELATAHLFGGRLHELHRVCLEALSISEDYEKCYQYPLVATGEIYTLLARGYAEWGENENAIQIARKGLLLCEQWGRFSGEQLARLYLGRALVLANHWEEALHEFEGAEQSAKKISSIVWQRDALYILDSVLDCEAIDATKIEQILQRLQSSGAHLPAMLNARLLLRDKQPDMVLSTLDKALAELGTEPSFDRVRIHALRALAFNVKGDKERAMTELQKALELGEPENRVATFVREGAAMEKLLRVALARGICSEFVQRLLNAFEARRKPEPTLDPGYTINKDIRSGEENMAEPLTERELEILRLLNSHLSTPEIADMLAVSVNTVRTHIKSIYSKLGVHSRSTAIDVSKKLKLLA